MLKIFSHRGFASKKNQQNKLESFEKAYQEGLRAIEFDIWYLEDQLFLKHNRPRNFNNLDHLEDLFLRFKNKVEYWLDFKNLHPRNCDLAISKVKKIIDDNQIKPNNLYFAPFITDLNKAKIIYQSIRTHFGNQAQIIAVIEKLLSKDYQKFYQQLKDLGIYGLSIEHQNINQKFKDIFFDIRIFAWTVNKQETADLLDKIGIENIASDNLKPTNDATRK